VPQSQTALDVTATTASIPPATVTTATTATTVTTPPPQVVEKPKPKPQPQPVETTTTGSSEESEERDTDATSSTSFPTYTEGGAAIVNESAINVARMQLKNVQQVALIGNGGHAILMNQVAEYLRDSGLTVVDGAEVVIYFNAKLDRLGLGRKRRSAEVTIT